MNDERLLVFRFPSFTEEGLLKNALGTVKEDLKHGRSPRWGVSAFAAVPAEHETPDDVLRRVTHDAPVTGKTVAVVLAQDLEEAGFPVILDEPPPRHHLIMLRDNAVLSDVGPLARILAEQRRPNPYWTGR